jgi:hypothetical protein
VPQWPAHLHHPPLHSFTFSQPLPARASGPLAPGLRADPRRSPLQLVSTAAVAPHPQFMSRVPRSRHVLRYRHRHPAAAATLKLPPPPHSTSRRRQPVSPASPGPLRYARCQPPPPVARAPGTPLPVRPTYIILLGTYTTAVAAAPVAASIPRPSRHQPLPPATPPGTSIPH